MTKGSPVRTLQKLLNPLKDLENFKRSCAKSFIFILKYTFFIVPFKKICINFAVYTNLHMITMPWASRFPRNRLEIINPITNPKNHLRYENIRHGDSPSTGDGSRSRWLKRYKLMQMRVGCPCKCDRRQLRMRIGSRSICYSNMHMRFWSQTGWQSRHPARRIRLPNRSFALIVKGVIVNHSYNHPLMKLTN